MITSRYFHAFYLLGFTAACLAFPHKADAALGFVPGINYVNPNAGGDPRSDWRPTIVTDENGLWVCVWEYGDNTLGGISAGLDGDLAISRSTNFGATWSAPAGLNSDFATDVRADTAPQLATDGAGNWVCVWQATIPSGKTDFDIYVAYSTDDAITWSAPVLLNSNASYGGQVNDQSPVVASDRSGNWVCAWYSFQSEIAPGVITGGDTDILVSRSSDSGATWSTVAVLNTLATTDSGNDSFPRIASDCNGQWVAVWESHETGISSKGADGDIVAATSSDNGLTWSGAVVVNSHGTSDSNNDYHPDIATDRTGNWISVWESYDPSAVAGQSLGTDPDIVVSRSTNNGLTWEPAVFVNNDAPTDPTTTRGRDWGPRIAYGAGYWLTAWYSVRSADDNEYDILGSASSNSGATWSNEEPINLNATSDLTIEDWEPQIATDRQGNWAAVWYSGLAVGGDYDIRVAISSSVPVTLSAFSME